MEFVVDKRTELISVILSLSQGNEYIEEHFSFSAKDEYRERVYEHFSKFKNHNAIRIAKHIAENDRGFNYDNPIRLAFSLNKQLEFTDNIEEYLLKELKNEKLLKEFMCEVVKFAKDSNFEKFYNSNSEYYLSKIEELKQIFNPELFIEELQKFFKININESYNVNIIPMLINANHGFKVDGDNFANIGLQSDDFKTIEKFNNGTLHMIIHEFMHNFVNCYSGDKYLQIPKYLQKELSIIGYDNAVSYLNDTIVRAITIRFREKIQKVDVQKFFVREENMGFIYVQNVYKELLEYEKQNLPWEKYFHKLISIMLNIQEKNKII